MSTIELARFWAKVNKDGPIPAHVPDIGRCWVWTGYRNLEGYGHFRFRGRSMGAHRVAWLMSGGPIPAGLCVLHKCDNPSCVRPDHLFLGTNADNVADKVAKGRQLTETMMAHIPRGDAHHSRLHPERLARGERHSSRTKPDRVCRGERHGNAKLTESDALDICRRRAAGEKLRVIAEDYGIAESAVSRIANGVRWPHLQSQVSKKEHPHVS